MVRSHIDYIVFLIFRTQIDSVDLKDARTKPILYDLYRVAVIKSITENIGPCYDSGILSPSSSKLLAEVLDQTIRKLRPQLIPLVEARAFPDLVIPSNIGNYYGDIYE